MGNSKHQKLTSFFLAGLSALCLSASTVLAKDSGGSKTEWVNFGFGINYTKGRALIQKKHQTGESNYYNAIIEGGQLSLSIVGSNGLYLAMPLEMMNVYSSGPDNDVQGQLIRMEKYGWGGKIGYSGPNLILLGEFLQGSLNGLGKDNLEPKTRYYEASVTLGYNLMRGIGGDLGLVLVGRHDKITRNLPADSVVAKEMNSLMLGVQADIAAPRLFFDVARVLFNNTGKKK